MNQLQKVAIDGILSKLKSHTRAEKIEHNILKHKDKNLNILFRPISTDNGVNLSGFSYIVDLYGNIERINEAKYEQLIEETYK